MKRQLLAAAVLGMCLGGIAATFAQSQVQTQVRLDFVWGSDSLNLPGLNSVLPQLRAYAAALNNSDMAAFTRLTAPDFSVAGTPGGTRVGAKALRHIVGFVTGFSHGNIPVAPDPDQPAVAEPGGYSWDLTGHTLAVHKVFAKSNKVVILLAETAVWAPAKQTKVSTGGKSALFMPGGSGIWHWRQTWIKTADGWKLGGIAPL